MLQKRPNRAVERTKGWIFEALMALLDEKSYAEIGISDITDKAGVARTTFYRNYESKDDIIIQYMDAIFATLLLKMKEGSHKSPKETLVILFGSFIEHHRISEKLLRNDLEHFLFLFANNYEALLVDIYQDTLPPEENLIFQYSVKYQTGGLMSMVTHWLKNNMPLSPEQMASIADEFLSPFKAQNRRITDLLLQIKN